MSCLSATFNVAAAALSLIGGAMLSTALWIAPEPTTLSKWAAAGMTIATIGAAAWLVAALIELINCAKESGVSSEEIDELEEVLEDLRDRIAELENQ